MNELPKTLTEYLESIARETAKMSYPGRMGGLVEKGTKKHLEEFFVRYFDSHLQELWHNASKIADRFDEWHHERVQELSQFLDDNKLVKDRSNRSEAIATKLLNTFLFQLMKYDRFRPLWKVLHLPLDRRVLEKLSGLAALQMRSRPRIGKILEERRQRPYSLSYDEYIEIQNALSNVVSELKAIVEYPLESRIELNKVLWADP